MQTGKAAAIKYRPTYRSSHRRCSVKKGVLRNFTKFTGKHLCQSIFFNKVAGLSPATLLKKILWQRGFSCEFCEISKNTFFTEHLLATASSLSNENTQDEIHADNIEKESTIRNSAFANKKLSSSSSITSKNATTISRNTLLINSTDFNANGNNKKFSRNS